MKDIYFEPTISEPNNRKKIIQFCTHWLSVLWPWLSVKVASKLLGNPFSRRHYQMRTSVKPVSHSVKTSVGDVCLHQFTGALSQADKNIFLCHGWGDSSTRFTQLIDHLLSEQFTVWSLDHVGHGLSKGSYCDLYCFIEGITKSVQFMDSKSASPIAIVGHSMGALGVMNLAPQVRADKKIVLISAPALFFENMHAAVESVGIAKSMLNNLLASVSARHGVDWQEFSAGNKISGLNKTPLFIHDSTDLTCPYANTKELAANVEHEFFTTHNLGHIKLLKDKALFEKLVAFVQGKNTI